MVSQNSAVRRISYHGDAKSEQIRLRNTDKQRLTQSFIELCQTLKIHQLEDCAKIKSVLMVRGTLLHSELLLELWWAITLFKLQQDAPQKYQSAKRSWCNAMMRSCSTSLFLGCDANSFTGFYLSRKFKQKYSDIHPSQHSNSKLLHACTCNKFTAIN